MTDDIVQRLRRQAARAAERPTLYDEAAYEIERLRAENAELRRHTHSCPYSDAEFWCMCAGPDHDADCLYDDEQENDR